MIKRNDERWNLSVPCLLYRISIILRTPTSKNSRNTNIQEYFIRNTISLKLGLRGLVHRVGAATLARAYLTSIEADILRPRQLDECTLPHFKAVRVNERSMVETWLQMYGLRRGVVNQRRKTLAFWKPLFIETALFKFLFFWVQPHAECTPFHAANPKPSL